MVETRRVEELFKEFRSRPDSKSLVALLRGNQDRIYNICYQVLRHPQDAEDASQEVLLELAEGCSRIHDVHAFKSWLYRVALNTALNHKKSRFARAELARRSAAMPTREGRSIPDEDASEVIDAIARLDDESRCLILEHYFEKISLEDLAKRERLSVTGIWKRLERAKGMLRQALIGAGFTISASSVTHALEAVAPVSAPAHLIAGTVISKAALVAAGGLAVASKSVISGAAVGLAFVFLAAGAGGGYWVGRKRTPEIVQARASGSDASNPVTTPSVADPAPPVEVGANAGNEIAPPLPEKASTPTEKKPPALPPHLKFGYATRFGPWKDFYEMANALGLPFDTMRQLVFKKLEWELKWTDEEQTAIRALIREEEEAVSKLVFAKYGNTNELLRLTNVSPSQKTAILDDIKSIRDSVVTSFTARYSIFTEDQVKAINERLRGDNLIFHSENGKPNVRSLPGYME